MPGKISVDEAALMATADAIDFNAAASTKVLDCLAMRLKHLVHRHTPFTKTSRIIPQCEHRITSNVETPRIER